MIAPDATLTIQRIPIASLQVKGEYVEEPSLERVAFYLQKMLDNPGMYAGLLYVVPSDTHANSYCILDGRHKYLASILAGRQDALCVVEG
jgi:hypothetical protein